MVNGVAEANLEEEKRWPLEETTEVENADQRVGRHLADGLETGGVLAGVPVGNLRGRVEAVGNFDGTRLKDSVQNALEEGVVRGGNVPEQLASGFSVGIRAVVEGFGWNGGQDRLGDAAFVGKKRKKKVVNILLGLLGGEGSHGRSPARKWATLTVGCGPRIGVAEYLALHRRHAWNLIIDGINEFDTGLCAVDLRVS